MPASAQRRSGDARKTSAGADRAAVHRVVAPAPVVAVPHEHIVATVAIEIPDAGHRPCQVSGERHAAARGLHPSPVHRVVVPAPVVGAAHEHVVAAVAVQVADAGQRPGEVAGERHLASPGAHRAAVHRVVPPAARVRVAQQHVRLAVAVEIAQDPLGAGDGFERRGGAEETDREDQREPLYRHGDPCCESPRRDCGRRWKAQRASRPFDAHERTSRVRDGGRGERRASGLAAAVQSD